MRLHVFGILSVLLCLCFTGVLSITEFLDVGDYDFEYYTSNTLSGENSTITSLVLVVHGVLRNADTYFELLSNVVQSLGQTETAVIAPHFQCPDDQDVPSRRLIFNCSGWLSGEAAINYGDVYSFTMIDLLLGKGHQTFPGLTSIIVTGHSAGGQTIQRYAASTLNGTTEKLGVSVKYVVANPGTYMYMNNLRVSASAAQNLNNTCPDAQNLCNLISSDFDDHYNNSTCTNYNTGKYGLDSPVGYIETIGAATVQAQYPYRNITYLLGDLDTLDNADLDVSCEAEAQGSFRKQRGLVFSQYAYDVLGVSKDRQAFTIVPGCGHNDTCMFESTAFIQTLGVTSQINPEIS